MLPLRATTLVREARHHRGQLGGAQPVEQALAQRFGQQQVGLGVEAGQLLAGVGELPAVDVAPRLQHPAHPVELPGQALAAPAHAALGALDVAVEAFECRRGPHLLLPLRVVRQRVLGQLAFELGQAALVAPRPPAVVAQLGPPEPVGGLAAEGRVAGCEGRGEVDGRGASRRRVEVLGAEAHHVARRSDRDQPAATAPAVLVVQHHHAPTSAAHDDDVTRTE